MSEDKKRDTGKETNQVIVVLQEEYPCEELENNKDIQLIVYRYEEGFYDGEGQLACYSTEKQMFWLYDMGHCSCFGPYDNYLTLGLSEDFQIPLSEYIELSTDAQDPFEPEIRAAIDKWLTENNIITSNPQMNQPNTLPESGTTCSVSTVIYDENNKSIFSETKTQPFNTLPYEIWKEIFKAGTKVKIPGSKHGPLTIVESYDEYEIIVKDNKGNEFSTTKRALALDFRVDSKYIPWTDRTVPKNTITVNRRDLRYPYNLLFRYISHGSGLLQADPSSSHNCPTTVAPKIIRLDYLFEYYVRLDNTPCGELTTNPQHSPENNG